MDPPHLNVSGFEFLDDVDKHFWQLQWLMQVSSIVGFFVFYEKKLCSVLGLITYLDDNQIISVCY